MTTQAIDIEQLIDRYEQESKTDLKTWTARMQAVVSGAIRARDIEAVTLACAAIADEAMAAQKTAEKPSVPRKNRDGSVTTRIDLTPTWEAVSHTHLRTLSRFKPGHRLHTAAIRELVRIGKIADWWIHRRTNA